jgi:hypothetical protein
MSAYNSIKPGRLSLKGSGLPTTIRKKTKTQREDLDETGVSRKRNIRSALDEALEALPENEGK